MNAHRRTRILKLSDILSSAQEEIEDLKTEEQESIDALLDRRDSRLGQMQDAYYALESAYDSLSGAIASLGDARN